MDLAAAAPDNTSKFTYEAPAACSLCISFLHASLPPAYSE
jgi:hypothetical protein